jgi:hypothetical protein
MQTVEGPGPRDGSGPFLFWGEKGRALLLSKCLVLDSPGYNEHLSFICIPSAKIGQIETDSEETVEGSHVCSFAGYLSKGFWKVGGQGSEFPGPGG